MAAHQLLCLWDSPGKNTGVGCHFLLQCMKVKSESEVAQSCPTPHDPMDCSLLGSSVHGIFQTRVLEWVAIDVTYVCVCVCVYTHIYVCVYVYIFISRRVAQLIKDLPAIQETWVRFLGQEDPLEKEMQPTPVFLPEKVTRAEDLGKLQSTGLQKSRTQQNNWTYTFNK